MLNKDAIARAMAEDQGTSIRKARGSVDMVIDAVSKALLEGDSVRLSGLGTLKVVDTAPRNVRNPHTGEPIALPASKRVKFSASSVLKKGVKE